MENYAVTRCRLHERAPQRRHPAEVVAVEIDLVSAYDGHHSLRSRGIGIAHGRPEVCPRRCHLRSWSFRVHYLRGFDSLGEKANPPINLPKTPLAVLIVGVFTAIAVAGSPCHHLRHGRAIPRDQKPELVSKALQPARRDVVLASRPGLAPLWFSRKRFLHLSSPPGGESVGAPLGYYPLAPRGQVVGGLSLRFLVGFCGQRNRRFSRRPYGAQHNIWGLAWPRSSARVAGTHPVFPGLRIETWGTLVLWRVKFARCGPPASQGHPLEPDHGSRFMTTFAARSGHHVARARCVSFSLRCGRQRYTVCAERSARVFP